jgi:toxin FitB
MNLIEKIVVDTNVVSELMNPVTHPSVQAWFDGMATTDLFLASTSLAELRLGVAIMPTGRRKSYLATALEKILAYFFEGRILAFDMKAAEKFSEIVSKARLKGRAIEIAGGQIAAIALVHGFSVATRDTAPFVAAGVDVIDPWME